MATRGVLCGVRVDDVERRRAVLVRLGVWLIVSWLHNLLSCWPWCGNPRSKSTRVLSDVPYYHPSDFHSCNFFDTAGWLFGLR